MTDFNQKDGWIITLISLLLLISGAIVLNRKLDDAEKDESVQ